MKKIVKYAFVIMAAVYIVFCTLVYFCPQYFFYNPTHRASNLEYARQNGYPAERVDYKSADGKELYAWYTAPGYQHKITVFMHGNSYNIEKFYHKMIPFVEAGYGTLMPEYRGFGDISGRIRQQNLENDALAAVNYLHSLGYKNSDIVIYGMSLGSHMAVNTVWQLQKKEPFAALVLEVPFDSLLNTVKAVVPVPLPFDYIVRDKYDNTSMIKDIRSPVLVMGGSLDPTVPVRLAKNLFALAPQPKKMIIYEGGAHNDLYNFRNYNDILNWLAKGKQ